MHAQQIPGGVRRPQLLVVADDPKRAAALWVAVGQATAGEAKVHVRTTLDTALDSARAGVGLCVYDLGPPDRLGLRGCVAVLHALGDAPLLVTALPAYAPLAAEAVSAGACQFLVFDGENITTLVGAIRRRLAALDSRPARSVESGSGAGTTFEILLQRANEPTGPDPTPAANRGMPHAPGEGVPAAAPGALAAAFVGIRRPRILA